MRAVRFFILFLASIAPKAADNPSPADFEFFEKEIRPLLINRCYECHGEQKQKGGLRLDSRAATLRGGDSGPALVPGEPEQSALIKAISYSDPDFQMPPKNPLPSREVQLLTEWVKRGAPDPRDEKSINAVAPEIKTDHWAYQPIVPIAPPASTSKWPRSDIDRFIFAKLEAQKLTPAADAEKETLVRRLYFDLIGLPPSPSQIDSFVKDESPTAIEKLVDELLASERFGERWARHWLDIARFAESVTLRGLVFSNAWRYRDYVIEAYNRDLPFDRFIQEQIAGDLLPTNSLADAHRKLAATTYLVLGNFNYEEQDKDQLRMDIVDEQLDTIGKGILGQTLGCARCHDHKFDPIPTTDYYAMAGILRNVKSAEHANVSTWLDLPLPLPADQESEQQEHERKIAELNRAIRKQTELITSLSPAKIISLQSLPGVVIDDAQAKLVGDWQPSTHNKPFLGAGYVHDRNHGKGSKTITFLPELKTSGKYEVRFAYTAGESRATNVPITILHAAGETTILVNERRQPPIDKHFVSLGQFEFEQGNQGYVIVSTSNTDGHVIADAVQFIPIDGLEKNAPNHSTTPTVELAKLNKDLEQLRRDLKNLTDSGPKRPMVMSIKEETTIEDTHVHIRGNVHNLGAKVPRGFLTVATREEAPVLPSAQSGRRELAAWITNPGNPLTARVYVNRVLSWLLGTGIVRTPDNFGTTGEPPTHPELLDFLAHQFLTNGWSTKKLVREIVLSRTYQMSTHNASAMETDSENRFYARANRRRLDAESLRDTILAISGRLDLTMGGASFKEGTTADFNYPDESQRRSVYVPAFRNALPQIFELFDFADTSVVSGQRHASIIAPQALYFLNHPFIQENARSAANKNSGSMPERIKRAYHEVLGRAPTTSELQLASEHCDAANHQVALTQLYQSLFASAEFRFLN